MCGMLGSDGLCEEVWERLGRMKVCQETGESDGLYEKSRGE